MYCDLTQLQELIKKYNLSYRTGNPEVPDEEFDELLDTYKKQVLEKDYKEFRKSLLESRGKVKLPYVLGSLEKVKYDEPKELDKFLKKNNIGILYGLEKIDGMSFTAFYRYGKLISATTRGDGELGEDITDKAKFVLPNEIGHKTSDFHIRGEMTFFGNTYKDFGYKNRRNGVVGVFNNDEPMENELLGVRAICYQILNTNLPRHQQISTLSQLGFITPWMFAVKHPGGNPNLSEYLKETLLELKEKHKDLYDMDGLVIFGKDYVGENVMLPEGMVAFKANSAGVKTTIKDIEWNVSKDGLIKPVAILEPVEIDGTTVSRATLYNYKYIIDNHIGVGAEVLIVKSGSIIPKVIEVIKTAPKPILNNCPNCGHLLVRPGVDLKCTNKCTEVLKVMKMLENFGVECVSEVSLQNWDINCFDDLFTWEPNPSLKSQTKFYSELISKVFNADEDTIMAKMPFEGAGKKIVQRIIDFYGESEFTDIVKNESWRNFADTRFPNGVGMLFMGKVASEWNDYLYIKDCILTHGKRIKRTEDIMTPKKAPSLSGKTFLITGTLSKPRKEIESLIESNGGTMSGSVSKNLSYLVLGDKPGSKLQKATSLGITVITEDHLLAMLA